MKGRRQRLDAEEALARLDLLDEVPGLARGHRGRVRRRKNARPRIRARPWHRLAHRMHHRARQGPQRALGGRIEQANRFDLVAQQLDAQRMAINRRKQIQHRPPHRERPRIFHHLHALKARLHQPLDEAFALDAGPGLDREAQALEVLARDHPPEKRAARGHHHRRAALPGQLEQQRHARHQRPAIGLHLGVGRATFGRQLLGGSGRRGIVAAGPLGQEEPQVSQARLGLVLVGDQEQHRPRPPPAGQPRCQRRPERSGGPDHLHQPRPAIVQRPLDVLEGRLETHALGRTGDLRCGRHRLGIQRGVGVNDGHGREVLHDGMGPRPCPHARRVPPHGTTSGGSPRADVLR